MNTVTLSITNLDQLQHGVTARHLFDCKGGTIGSGRANWQINDRDQTVAPIHCEIRWIEGSFCVIDHCHRTYLNGSANSWGRFHPDAWLRVTSFSLVPIGYRFSTPRIRPARARWRTCSTRTRGCSTA